MTWTAFTFTAGDILTATQLNNLSANVTAQANGDASAPANVLASMASNSVDSDQLVAASVNQGELATAQGEVSGAGTGAFGTLMTLPGGEYGFYPEVRSSTASSTYQFLITGSTGITSYFTRITTIRNTGSSGSGFARHRYITASPPYDLGDGEIPLFIFALLDKKGKVLCTYAAPEAPWHHNGPTKLRPDECINGRKFKRVKVVTEALEYLMEPAANVFAKTGRGESPTDAEIKILKEYTRAYRDAPDQLVEITQEMKQADMALIPHPFDSMEEGQIPVLLDPLSPLMEDLAEMLKVEPFGVSSLLVEGALKIGNEPLKRAGPPGVLVVPFEWRNAG